MLPRRWAPLLFGLLLSGLMSLLVSGIASWRHAGPGMAWLIPWMSAWLTAWPVAFPAVLLAAPLTRRVVDRLVAPA